MGPLFYWKLAGGAVAGLLLLLAVGELQRLNHRSNAYADCQAVAAGKPGATKGARCADLVVEQLQAARSAAACDQGLGPLKAEPGRWGSPASCSAKIRDLVVRHNVGQDALADRDLELDRLQRGQAAAIARAQARGASTARSYANAKAALDAAPRDPDGLIRCGPDCLRQLAGQGPPAGSGADHRASP